MVAAGGDIRGNRNYRLHQRCRRYTIDRHLLVECSIQAKHNAFPRLLNQLMRFQPVNFCWRASEYPQIVSFHISAAV